MSLKNEKILASELFDKLEDFRRKAKIDNNKIFNIYCCMYQMALIESQQKNVFSHIISDKINLNKHEYEEILYGLESYKKMYKNFVHKNIFVSVALFTLFFSVLRFSLKFPLSMSLVVGLLVFFADMYMNGKTNEKRFNDIWLRKVKKFVDNKTLQYINTYFK